MKSLSGDYITETNFAQYKNVLILHSYHYNWPSKMSSIQKFERGIETKEEVRIKETYARKIGLELEKMSLPNTIVRESPKRRNVSSLLKRYKAKWMLDLHDPGRPYNPKHDNNSYGQKQIADLAIFPYYSKNRMENLQDNLRGFAMKKYNVKDWWGSLVGIYDIPYENYNSRYIAVELITGNSKKKSINFVKSLSEYLQTL